MTTEMSTAEQIRDENEQYWAKCRELDSAEREYEAERPEREYAEERDEY